MCYGGLSDLSQNVKTTQAYRCHQCLLKHQIQRRKGGGFKSPESKEKAKQKKPLEIENKNLVVFALPPFFLF